MPHRSLVERNAPTNERGEAWVLEDRFELRSALGVDERTRDVLAFDTRHKRPAVVRFLRTAADESLRPTLGRIARALNRTDSPHILSVLSGGFEKEHAYVVAEHAPGRSLHERLLRGRIGPRTAVTVVRELCDGLAAAHSVGVMHFDLKPSDVRLCRDGLVRVGGFGLAAVCRSDGRASGWSGGSRLYAAPERVRGGALDARSDVYSAGALLYVMVSGRLPRGGGATPGSGLSYLSERVAKLADVAPDLHVPDGLEWVLQRALAPNANERFQSMDDMKTALLALEEGLVPEVESLEPMSRRDTDEAPIRRSGRAKRAMLVASFAMASLGLMAAMAAIVLTVVGPPLPASDMTVVHITGDIAVEDIVIRDVDGLQVAGSEMPPGQYTLHVNFGAGLRPHADMLLRGGPVQVDCWRASAHCNVQAVP